MCDTNPPEKERFWVQFDEGIRALQADPEAWADYWREWREWEEGTIADGLGPGDGADIAPPTPPHPTGSMTMHSRPMADGEGDFSAWKPTRADNPNFKCRRCGSDDVLYRAGDSHCGSWTDHQYHCQGCDRRWWVEGDGDEQRDGLKRLKRRPAPRRGTAQGRPVRARLKPSQEPVSNR
jgi:hypothetical protein